MQALLGDRRLRSPITQFIEMQGVTDGLLHDRMCKTLLAIDGDDHTRVRNLVRKAFVPKAIDRHRPLMRSVLASLLAPVIERGRCEFVAEVADHYPIQVMCEVLGVSRSGYYAWASRPESARAVEDHAVVAEIRTAHEDSRGRYGSPRVHATLRGHGRRVGRKRVARLMRGMGLSARRKRRFRRTTDRSDR